VAEIGIKQGGLLDKALRELADKVSKPAVLRAGFLENATYPDGTSVASIAAIQNFGAPAAGIPARPFFTDAVKRGSPEWAGKLAALLKMTDYDAEKALTMMGPVLAFDIQKSITETNAPPLSEVTVQLRAMRKADPDLVVTGATVGEAADRARRGVPTDGVSTKPLVDTGTMFRYVSFEVTPS
jgi:hypothetical protein